MSTTRTLEPVRFAVPSTPPVAQAASVALAVARYAKCGSWTELAEKVHAGDEATLRLLAAVDIDEATEALLETHEAVLSLLRVRPLLTIAVCPECLRWTLSAGAVPTRCKTNRGCVGKPVKASIAARVKAPATPAT